MAAPPPSTDGSDRMSHPSRMMRRMSMAQVPMLPFCGPDHVHVDIWTCPVCDARIVHAVRPGRRRVYCTNACRQRAYRWRRQNQVFTTHTNARPTERALGRSGVRHALRTDRDFVAGRSYGRQREEVTVCGVLARPSRSPRVAHYRFTPGLWTCESCETLTFAELPPPFVYPIPPPAWRPPMRLPAAA